MRRRSLIILAVIAATAASAAIAQTRDENWARCRDAGVPDRAIASCTAILQTGGETSANLSMALVHRGAAHAAGGRPDRAVQDHDQAIRLDPDNALAFHGRGNAHYLQRQYDRAMADYDQAIRLAPKVARFYRDRGTLFDDLGRSDRAIQDYDQALRLDPADALAYYDRGVAYSGRGQHQRSIADFDRAIRRAPADPRAYKARGQARFFLARYRAAATDLGRAFELSHGDAYAALWRHLALARDRRERDSNLRGQAASLDMTRWPGAVVRHYLGEAGADQVLQAARHADPAIERDQFCEAFFYLGQAALDRGDKAEAARLFRSSLDTGVTTFIEYKAAKAELARLGR